MFSSSSQWNLAFGISMLMQIFFLFFSAKNAIGNTTAEANGDLELTINVLDINDNDPVFDPPWKCKEMDDGTAGRKYRMIIQL